jgi:putative NADPH-quinone reductase
MKISLILAHPDPLSFNHAIAFKAFEVLKLNGQDVFFHDLYKEKFDPLLTSGEITKKTDLPKAIQQHCTEIAAADGIIIVHPNWWGQPPAILKGWVDRILRPGVAYKFMEGDSGEGVPQGLLKARKVLIYNTSNTKSAREKKVFGDPLETIWKNCVFGLCGIDNFHRRMFNVVVTSTWAERGKWLEAVGRDIDKFFPPSSSGD